MVKKQKYVRQQYMESESTRKLMDKKIGRQQLSKFIRSATLEALKNHEK